MVKYTFCCRRCGHHWSKACARDVVRLVKCPRCGHDRIDYDVADVPLPSKADQPFILGVNQRMLLVFTARSKGVSTVEVLAGLNLKSNTETRESLQGLADARMIELSDAGDVTLTELGLLLAVNIREMMKGGG